MGCGCFLFHISTCGMHTEYREQCTVHETQHEMRWIFFFFLFFLCFLSVALDFFLLVLFIRHSRISFVFILYMKYLFTTPYIFYENFYLLFQLLPRTIRHTEIIIIRIVMPILSNAGQRSFLSGDRDFYSLPLT